MIGLEFAIWGALQDGDRRYGMGEMDAEQLERCHTLANELDGWVIWVNDEDVPGLPVGQWGPRFVPMDRWMVLLGGMRKESDMAAKYHGFTCPKCGSHMFGTHKRADGRSMGMCHENQYSGNACAYEWDRDDKEAEAACMYQQTPEEWADEFWGDAPRQQQRATPAQQTGGFGDFDDDIPFRQFAPGRAALVV